MESEIQEVEKIDLGLQGSRARYPNHKYYPIPRRYSTKNRDEFPVVDT